MSDQFPLFDIDDAINALFAGKKEDHYEDPGEEGYDSLHENQVRVMMELAAFYDETGPRSDPDGKYLCGSCSQRQGKNACLFVEGDISFTTGSCNIYTHGDPLDESYELKEKLTQLEVGYALRPKEKAFGCSRCEYGAEAQAPDTEDRPSWCAEWGVHILPTACCMRHKGDDMIIPSEEDEEDTEENDA
jgi:hypothetical protein